MNLANDVLQGNRLALARLLTQIENETGLARRVMDELYGFTGQAHLVGVTGPPGTGKSSLVNQLARFYRDANHGHQKRIGVVAVDPSSPFTGGAILGDRVRMRDLSGDRGVFIRSMASRGSLGGLAAATSGVVQALDAAGFEIIFIETVGAGQAEVEIARLAHTTLVIEAPGLGDEIQAIKAGILEIADILVVNKVDRPGAEASVRALQSMLHLAHPMQHVFLERGIKPGGETIKTDFPTSGESDKKKQGKGAPWIPPILTTVATEGKGVEELVKAIERHYDHLKVTDELQQRELARLKSELDALLRERLLSRWQEQVTESHYAEIVQKVAQHELSPRQAVDVLIRGN